MDDILFKYPLVISYPRSGAHFFCGFMEAYFDRPRLRAGGATFLDSQRTDWLWLYDHDKKLNVLKCLEKNGYPYGKLLYLYRNPVDTLYSGIAHQIDYYEKYKKLMKPPCFPVGWTEDIVRLNANDLQKHRNAYFNTGFVVPIKYESLISSTKLVALICKILKQPYDKKRAEHLFKKYDRQYLTWYEKQVFGIMPYMEDKEYTDKREWFRNTYGRMINEIVIS